MDPQSEKKHKRKHKEAGGSEDVKKHKHKEKKHKKESKEKHHKKHRPSAAAAGAAAGEPAPSRPAVEGTPSKRKAGAVHSPVSSLSLSSDSEDAQVAPAARPAAADSRQQPRQQGGSGTAGGADVGDQLWEDEALPPEEQEEAVQTQQDKDSDEEKGEGEEEEEEQLEPRWRRPTTMFDPLREWEPPVPAFSSGSSSSEGEEDEEEGGSDSDSGEGVEVLNELPELAGVAEGREELWLVRLPPRLRLNKLRGAVLRCPAEGPLTTGAPPPGAPGSAPRTSIAAALLQDGRPLGSVATSALEAAAEKEAKEQGPQLDKAADAFSPTGDMPLAGSRQYGDYQQYVANEPDQPAGQCVAPPRAPKGEVELGRLLTAPAKKPRHRTWRAWRVLQEMPLADVEMMVVGDTGGGVPFTREMTPPSPPAPLGSDVDEESYPYGYDLSHSPNGGSSPERSPGGGGGSSSSLDSSQGGSPGGDAKDGSLGPSSQLKRLVVGGILEPVEPQYEDGMEQLEGFIPTRMVVLTADTEAINTRLPGLVWKVCEPVAAAQGWPLITSADTATGEERCQQLLPGLGTARTAADGLALPLLDGDQQLVGVSLGGHSSDEETDEEGATVGGVKRRRLKPLARPLQKGPSREVPAAHQAQVAEGYYHSVRLRRWEAARRRFLKQHGKQQQQGPGDGPKSPATRRKEQEQGPSWDPLWQLRQDWDEGEQGPGGAPDWTLDGALYPHQAPDTNTEEDWLRHYAAAEAAFAGKQGAHTEERQRKAEQRAAALAERAAAAEAEGEEVEEDPAKHEASAAGNGYADPTEELLWGARGVPQEGAGAKDGPAAAAGTQQIPGAAAAAGGDGVADFDLGPGLAGLLDVEVALGQQDWLALAEGPAGDGPGASMLDAAEEEHGIGKLATPWYPLGTGDVLNGGRPQLPVELPEEVVARAADLPTSVRHSVRRQLADLLTAAGLAVARQDQPGQQQQQDGSAAPAATAAARPGASNSSSSSSSSWWAPASDDLWQAKMRAPRQPAQTASIEELDAMLMAWGHALQERLADEAVGLQGSFDHVPDLPLLPPRIVESNLAPRMAYFLSTSALLPDDMKQGPLEEDVSWWRRFLPWLQPHAFFRDGQLVAMVTQARMQQHLAKDEAAAAARQAAGGGHEDSNRDRPLYVPEDITPAAWSSLVEAAAAQDLPAHTLLVLQGPQGPGQQEMLAAAVAQEVAVQVTLEAADPGADAVGVMQELIPVPQRWRLGRSCLQPDPEYLAYCNANGDPLVRQKARDCVLPVDGPAAAAPALYLRPDVVRAKRGDGPVLVLTANQRVEAYQDQGRFDWADAPTWEEHEEANEAHELGVEWEEGEEEEEQEEGGVRDLATVVAEMSSEEESD